MKKKLKNQTKPVFLWSWNNIFLQFSFLAQRVRHSVLHIYVEIRCFVSPRCLWLCECKWEREREREQNACLSPLLLHACVCVSVKLKMKAHFLSLSRMLRSLSLDFFMKMRVNSKEKWLLISTPLGWVCSPRREEVSFHTENRIPHFPLLYTPLNDIELIPWEKRREKSRVFSLFAQFFCW